MPALLTTMETSPQARAASAMSSALVTSSDDRDEVLVRDGRGVTGGAVDLGAGVEERLGDGGAQAAVGSGDECGCVVDVHRGSSLYWARNARERATNCWWHWKMPPWPASWYTTSSAFGQAVDQVEGVDRGHHPVALAVGHEDGLADDREVGGLLLAPAVDGLELGAVGAERDGLVAVVGALVQAGQELLAGSAPLGCPGEEEVLLRVRQGEQPSEGVEVRDPGDAGDALAAGGTGAGEDDPADELRFVGGDQLGDHAAHREPEEVDLLEAEGPDERDGVLRHRLDGGGRGAGRGADAPVVEDDDPVLGGDAVDDPGIPVVQDGGEVGEEDHGDAGGRADPAVGEVDAADGDRAGRRRRVGRHHVEPVVVLIDPCLRPHRELLPFRL